MLPESPMAVSPAQLAPRPIPIKPPTPPAAVSLKWHYQLVEPQGHARRLGPSMYALEMAQLGDFRVPINRYNI
jgi:hypothetical protein